MSHGGVRPRRHRALLTRWTLPLAVALVATWTAPAHGSYGPTPVVDYSCPNDYSNNGKYVPPGHYWENDFTAQGTKITGGYLALGANVDGNSHQARIDIYTGSARTGSLAEVVVDVAGYGGVHFTFPTPASVSPGQHLWIAASGIGDFTAYDEAVKNGVEGCFIGEVDGTAPPPPDSTPPAVKTFSYTPHSVDVSSSAQQLDVQVEETDDVSGVGNPGTITFRGPGSAQATATLTQSGGTALDGTYKATVTIPRNAAPGTWTPILSGVADQAGNQLPAGTPPGNPPELTVTSATPDTLAPAVVGYGFTPASVDAGGTVQVTIHVTDDKSGTDGPARLGFVAPDGTVYDAAAQRQSGTPADGTYSATVTIPRNAPGGTYEAEIPAFADLAGNTVGAGPPPQGMPSRLLVTAAPPPAPTFAYAIANVNAVNLRSGPGTNFSVVGSLRGGSPIAIVCQTQGTNINGSPVWDELAGGNYVSDWYTTTPSVGTYSPGIPRCPGAPPPPSTPSYHVTATVPLQEHSGPGSGYAVTGSLAPGAGVELFCQTYGTYVYGSPVWDRLTNGRYVSDYFVSTPVFAYFSPGLAVCAGTGARPAAPASPGGGGQTPHAPSNNPTGSISAGSGAASPPPSAASCTDSIVFIGARGTNEGDVGFGSTVRLVLSAVTRRFGAAVLQDSLNGAYNVKFDGNPFTWPELVNYSGDAASAANTIKDRIREYVSSRPSRCTPLKIVLVGYSFGAWAVGDAVSELEGRYQRNIKAVVLFGDPRSGLGPLSYRALPNSVPSRSYCLHGDPVCDSASTTAGIVAACFSGHSDGCPHYRYVDADTQAAARFVISQLGG